MMRCTKCGDTYAPWTHHAPVCMRADCRAALVPLRRCKACKSRVAAGLDCYTCPRCGVLPAGLFVEDPTEREPP